MVMKKKAIGLSPFVYKKMLMSILNVQMCCLNLILRNVYACARGFGNEEGTKQCKCLIKRSVTKHAIVQHYESLQYVKYKATSVTTFILYEGKNLTLLLGYKRTHLKCFCQVYKRRLRKNIKIKR